MVRHSVSDCRFIVALTHAEDDTQPDRVTLPPTLDPGVCVVRVSNMDGRGMNELRAQLQAAAAELVTAELTALVVASEDHSFLPKSPARSPLGRGTL
jgi:hypothetical protein